jgi:hypothetical protein
MHTRFEPGMKDKIIRGLHQSPRFAVQEETYYRWGGEVEQFAEDSDE